jgi:aspartate-semialdehyde dehydrogenase
MIQVLEERDFPVGELVLYASSRSAGSRLTFKEQEVEVRELNRSSLVPLDTALFSAGSSVSLEFAPLVADLGAVVIDNSSAFRMEPEVPLVVPEVNSQAAFNHHGIIANPNCSTIQMVVVLYPLQQAAGIKRIVVSTYQSVSGTGKKAVDELMEQSRLLLEGQPCPKPAVYHRRIGFSLFPHIDVFLDNGSTREEWKMVEETKKIMNLPDLKMSVTCARVPVRIGHAEAINVEFERDLSADTARKLLVAAPGVIVLDSPDHCRYPTPEDCEDRDEVFVGRVRRDESVSHGLNLWVVADNLRKGAASNAVQIAETLFVSSP